MKYFILIFIILLSGCDIEHNHTSIEYKDYEITSSQISKFQSGDFYEYEGIVEYNGINEYYTSNLYLSQNFYDNSFDSILVDTNIESDYFEYFTEQSWFQNSQGNVFLKEDDLFNICYNERGFECNGNLKYYYFSNINQQYFSIENNSFVHDRVEYIYSSEFHYEGEVAVNTDIGLFYIQRIWFETYTVNMKNDVVKQEGWYWIHPNMGIIKKEYTEYEINNKYTFYYNYSLKYSNKVY